MKPWTIRFDGKTWTDEGCTTAQCVAVADLIGDSWDAVSPWSGPRSLAAWIAVLVASGSGDLPVAVQQVYAMPLNDLGGCIDERPADSGVPAVVPANPVAPSGVSFVDAA